MESQLRDQLKALRQRAFALADAVNMGIPKLKIKEELIGIANGLTQAIEREQIAADKVKIRSKNWHLH